MIKKSPPAQRENQLAIQGVLEIRHHQRAGLPVCPVDDKPAQEGQRHGPHVRKDQMGQSERRGARHPQRDPVELAAFPPGLAGLFSQDVISVMT